jgi:hypothetical protein
MMSRSRVVVVVVEMFKQVVLFIIFGPRPRRTAKILP